MNLNAITLAITRPGAVRSWDPLAMFTTGVAGAWYDPSDTTTLYRDAAGTLPVTAVEQPVGLMLDKSKGLVLGPELVTNGDFSNGTAGWSGQANVTLSVESGELKGVTSSINSTYAYQDAVTVSGRWYKATATVRSLSGKVRLSAWNGAFSTSLAFVDITTTVNSLVTIYFLAASTSTRIAVGLDNSSASTYYFDNISVRELPGNHAFNSSGNSANFPVLSARYNLLTKTEAFDDAAWSKYNVTVTPNTTIAPDGTTTADTFTTTSSLAALYSSGFTSPGPSKWSIKAKPGTSRYLALIVGNNQGDQGYVVFDIQDGVVGQTGNGAGTTSVSGSITQSSQGFFVCTISYTRTTSGNCKIELAPALTGNTFDSNGEVIGNPVGSSAIIWGADLRAANDALNQPAYQRVNTATDYDTVGFKPYLKFNGTNQWLQTNSIDFTYGDKMFVSAGVRKLADGNYGVVAEISTSYDLNGGVFSAGGGFSPDLVFASKGTISALASYNAAAPTTKVLSGVGNIFGDRAILRLNGTQVAEITTNQGIGNYGNYPLYIGARAGTSLWFNGRLYQMVVTGKQASAAEITSTETYINQKTGAF